MSDGKKRKKNKKAKGPKRIERRFVAQSSQSPWLVRVLAALGAMLLGAGAWAFVYAHSFEHDEKLRPLPAYVVAAGSVITGIAIWLGTSSEPPIRVGAPGIAVERGDLRRMPWSGLAKLTYEASTHALVLVGDDESGQSWTFRVSAKAHPEAVGWILKESLDRVPKVVKIDDATVDKLPGAPPHAGMQIELEPLQVVGRKDAATGQLISYEPDARVCTRCERVYFKRSIPKKCKCGASLFALRSTVVEEAYENDDEEAAAEAAAEEAEREAREAEREAARASSDHDDDEPDSGERASERGRARSRAKVDEAEST